MSDPRPGRPLWQPTQLLREVEQYDTSMGTTKVKTDATFAYIKVLGNRQGPHALACELVGTSLARWFGLTVPDFAVVDVPSSACFSLPRGAEAQPGPAFLSRHVDGRTWSGSEADLHSLTNRDDITRLVVFDTWIRNCDRHPPEIASRRPNYGNVYLAATDRPARSRLVAIDHTHCLNCGNELTDRIAQIDRVKDDRTYGFFPQFTPFLEVNALAWAAAMLGSIVRADIEELVATIPAAWQVTERARTAVVDLVVGRAAFLVHRIDAGWPLDQRPAGHCAEDGAPERSS